MCHTSAWVTFNNTMNTRDITGRLKEVKKIREKSMSCKSVIYLFSIYVTLTIKLDFWHFEMWLAFHDE